MGQGDNSTINNIGIIYNETLNDQTNEYPSKFWINVELKDGRQFRFEFDREMDLLNVQQPNETIKFWIANLDGTTYQRHIPSLENRHVNLALDFMYLVFNILRLSLIYRAGLHMLW